MALSQTLLSTATQDTGSVHNDVVIVKHVATEAHSPSRRDSVGDNGRTVPYGTIEER
jgi:hypothetical protein